MDILNGARLWTAQEMWGARLHATSLTREAGPPAGWMSSTPAAVLAAFFLWVFTLVGSTRVFDTVTL